MISFPYPRGASTGDVCSPLICRDNIPFTVFIANVFLSHLFVSFLLIFPIFQLELAQTFLTGGFQ
jgi:hypothetical protein